MKTTVICEVKARPEGFWNATGVIIREGDRVTVKFLHGEWRTNPHWGPVGAAGNPAYSAGGTYLLPGAPEGSLIGKVGGVNNGGGSAPFAVGGLSSIPEALKGELWLTANDEAGAGTGNGFGDNSGSLTVEVSHEFD
ncbi:MAG: hypothetical protein IPK32_05760 [Verrucomicrobiaceae bacterium]|nr:hypothetical protein [Verrucomicrobiaceae bacterium]